MIEFISPQFLGEAMKKTYHTEEKSLPPYQRTKISSDPNINRGLVFLSRDGKTNTTVTYIKEEK